MRSHNASRQKAGTLHTNCHDIDCQSVAALHQDTPGQMTWLENPPLWLKPCLLLCFGNSVNRKLKCYHIWPLYLFYFDGETALAAVFCVLSATTKKGRQLFLRKKVYPDDLAGGFSDLEMTWLLYYAGAATAVSASGPAVTCF